MKSIVWAFALLALQSAISLPAVTFESASPWTSHEKAAAKTSKTEDGRLVVELEDNGHGMKPHNKTGSGLNNMRKRARKLNATLLVEPTSDGGTRVRFECDLDD